MGPRRADDLPVMDSESESDSHTDCSPPAIEVEVDGRPLEEVAVICLVIGGESEAGLGTGLGQPVAGMNIA